MGKCGYCGESSLSSKGCIKVPIMHKGKAFEPIRMGQASYRFKDFYFDKLDIETCEDCGASRDHYHHPGCENETCPVCGKKLIYCGCSDKSLSCLWKASHQLWVYR